MDCEYIDYMELIGRYKFIDSRKCYNLAFTVLYIFFSN